MGIWTLLAALLVQAPDDSVNVAHRWCFHAVDTLVVEECLFEADQLRKPGLCASCLEETLGLVRRFEPTA